MAKRVSMKGKGADLFFGEEEPSVEEAIENETEQVVLDEQPEADIALAEPIIRDSKPATKQESEKASTDATKIASMYADSVNGESASKLAVGETQNLEAHALDEHILETIWARLVSPAPVTNSFRYTAEELQALEDVLYEISKQHSTKLTKQDVARLGLNAVLSDYQERGSDSLLTAFAMRKKRQRGGK